jgi:hypothetical protein
MKRLLIIVGIIAVWVAPCIGQPVSPADEKISLRILYAGMPGTAREKEFVSFLTEHFVAVKAVDVTSFTADQADESDVVILDKDGIQWGGRGEHPLRDLVLPKDFARATLALGIPGAFLYDRMRLLPGYR